MRSSCGLPRLRRGFGAHARLCVKCGADQLKRIRRGKRTIGTRSWVRPCRDVVGASSVTRTSLAGVAECRSARLTDDRQDPLSCGRHAVALHVGAAGCKSQRSRTLKISHRARAVSPGEVVLVDVRAAALRDVQAQWLSQTVLFYQVEPGWWQGLAPIDVAAAAGRQTLGRAADDHDGRALERAYPITIAPGRSRHAESRSSRNSWIRLPMNCRESKRSGRRSKRFSRSRHESASGASRSSCRFPAPQRAASAAAPSSTAHREASIREPTFRQPPARPSWPRTAAASRSPPTSTSRAEHVIIDHGLGVYSYLAHLSEFTVAEGPSSSAVNGSRSQAQPAASPDRTCTGRCASAAREWIRCRWWRY